MNQAKILIIDDEPTMRTKLKKLLSSEGYEVYEAESGLQGLEIFERETPRVVLVDLRLPDMDGIGVLKRIKEKSPKTGVIIITGQGDMKTAIEALGLGAFNYITKPLEYDELSLNIQRALDIQEMQRKLDDYVRSLEIAVQERERELSLRKKAEEQERQLAIQAVQAAEVEKKRAAELEKAYEELSATQAKLIQMEKLSALGQLSAGLAHEINNPLAVISSLAQYLLELLEGIKLSQIDHAQFVECLESLRKIVQESERCGTITYRLLQFATPKPPKMESTNINEAIKEVLSLTLYTLSLKKITIHERLASDLPKVKANGDQLKQVFMNILLNAQTAMPEGGQLMVETLYNPQDGDGKVEIQFADTGVGIPEGIRGRIFDPFFTTKPVGQGVGLGLSVSYGIVKAHGGTIAVASQVNKGTTFIIKLPVQENRLRQ